MTRRPAEYSETALPAFAKEYGSEQLAATMKVFHPASICDSEDDHTTADSATNSER